MKKLSPHIKKFKNNIIVSYLIPYFFYNSSYISGDKYWFRKLLQWPLIFLYIGLYLRVVTTYTRSRSLNISIIGSFLFSIYSFIIDFYIIAIIPFNAKFELVSDDMFWVFIIPVLPMTYLLFADGKSPPRLKP